MAKYYDLDTDTRINGKLTVNGDITIPSSYNLIASGNITGNSIFATGTLSGNTIRGNGAQLIVSGNTANGGTVPISNGWAYTHENKVGSQGHIPTGGTATTFLRGDNTWVTPTDTNNYVSSLSSNAGGNGTLTVNRNGLTALTIDLSHNHDSVYYTETEVNTLLNGKDYYGKWNLVAGGTTTGITASANVTVTGNGATSVSLVGNTLTISSTDTNTWRPIDTVPANGNTGNSISSDWAYDHSNTFGLGSHVPSGGSATTFLRGDGTWVTPTDTNTWRPIDNTPTSGNTNNSISSDWSYKHINTTGIGSHIPTGGDATKFLRGDGTWQVVPITDTNNYVTAISGNGNGTLYIDRSGLTTLSLSLAHNHDSSYLKYAGGTMSGNITMPLAQATGNMYSYQTNYRDAGHYIRFQYQEDDNTTALDGIRIAGYSGIELYTNIGSKQVATFRASAIKFNYPLTVSGNTTISGNITVTGTVDGVDISSHASSTGISGHIPSGGTTSQYLRGDGTWATPPDTDTNNYVSGISSTAGGNGTLTLNRSGLADLTLNLSHTHSQYVTNNSANQSVLTGFTMSGNSYVGTSSTAGALNIRTTNGAVAIQLAGDNSAQQAGVTAYINASGNANFSGTVSANSLIVASNGVIANLNAEMINSVKEEKLVKNITTNDLGGKGVHTGCVVTQTSPAPNMSVVISSGIVYTDSGLRKVFNNNSITLSTSSSSYDRLDVIYVRGSSGGNNEGNLAVAIGTPSATPVEPSIPSDAVKLAVIRVPKSIGTITDSYITDAREFMKMRTRTDNITEVATLYPKVITSDSATVVFNKPIKTPSATSITFSAGETSKTWTHNLNAGTGYAVRLSCNSAEPHVYWSSKLTDKITINLDDVCESDVIVDISLEYY